MSTATARPTDSVNGITHTYTINTNRLVAVDSTTYVFTVSTPAGRDAEATVPALT